MGLNFNLLNIIIGLCNMNGGSVEKVHEAQLYCQKYYIACIKDGKERSIESRLEKCIIDKEGKL